MLSDTPLAPLKARETLMERNERLQHTFGSEPLAVNGGVALTEEAVELHVPNVVTRLRNKFEGLERKASGNHGGQGR